MRSLMSLVVGRSLSLADLAGGALEMLIFLEGLFLFHAAKFLSNMYLRDEVLKVTISSASNCLPFVFVW